MVTEEEPGVGSRHTARCWVCDLGKSSAGGSRQAQEVRREGLGRDPLPAWDQGGL